MTIEYAAQKFGAYGEHNTALSGLHLRHLRKKTNTKTHTTVLIRRNKDGTLTCQKTNLCAKQTISEFHKTYGSSSYDWYRDLSSGERKGLQALLSSVLDSDVRTLSYVITKLVQEGIILDLSTPNGTGDPLTDRTIELYRKYGRTPSTEELALSFRNNPIRINGKTKPT